MCHLQDFPNNDTKYLQLWQINFKTSLKYNMETTISLLGHLSKIQQFSYKDSLMNYTQQIIK